MKRGLGPFAPFQVGGEIAENVHWQFPNLPPQRHRHVKNQETVDASLVLSERRSIRYVRITALIVNIKGIAAAGIIIKRRCDLEEYAVRKCDPRASLPGH